MTAPTIAEIQESTFDAVEATEALRSFVRAHSARATADGVILNVDDMRALAMLADLAHGRTAGARDAAVGLIRSVAVK